MSNRIEPIAEQAILRLRQAANGGCLTLFIDPILADPLRESPHLIDANANMVKLSGIHADIDSNRAPYLLCVSDEVAAERLVNESVRLAVREGVGDLGSDYRGRSLCGWICGEPDPQTLAARLSRVARVIRPNRELWPLRFWDPRVIWHLPRVLSPEQWSVVSSQIGDWWALGPMLRLERFGTKPNTLVSAGTVESARLPMRFDQTEWQKLERIVTINKLFGMSLDWGVLPGEEQARRIDSLLVRCAEWGYTTERDMLVFAACALTSHVSFDQHPQVADALHRGVQQRTSLQAVLAGFDDDFWADVARGEWLSPQFADLNTG